MADTETATDAPPLPTEVDTALEMAKAGLTKDEATQFETVVAPHVADGTLSDAEIFQAKTDVVEVHDRIEAAHESQHEQAVNAESGNFAAAQENATVAAYDLRVADNLGADAAHPTIDAQQDHQQHEVAALGNAAWEQATQVSYEQDAHAHAASGDYDHAAQSADTAGAHAETASTYGHEGDHGGSTAASAAPAETSGETTAE